MQTLAYPMPDTVNGRPLVQQGRGDSLQWVAQHSPRSYTSYSVHRARTESGALTLKWSAVSYDTGGMPFARVPFAPTPGHALLAVMALDGSSPSRIAEVASALAPAPTEDAEPYCDHNPAALMPVDMYVCECGAYVDPDTGREFAAVELAGVDPATRDPYAYPAGYDTVTDAHGA